jgi:hypothetical protein
MAKNESIVEDQYPMSLMDMKIGEAISHWHVQRHYEGTSWEGIEKFHLKLATVVENLVLEVPVGSAWYSYPSTQKMAAKDWRYVVIDPPGILPTVVNAHSVVHDDAWSLVTTLYSSAEIDESSLGEPIGHFDPWVRSMLWSVELAAKLSSDGYDFSSVIEDMKYRMMLCQRVWKRMKEVRITIENEFSDMFGREPDFPDYFLVVVADWDLPEGKIASYNYADKEPWGTLAISPRAFEKGIHDAVIKHELCHAAVGENTDDPHGEEFQRLADWLGIPKEHQD